MAFSGRGEGEMIMAFEGFEPFAPEDQGIPSWVVRIGGGMRDRRIASGMGVPSGLEYDGIVRQAKRKSRKAWIRASGGKR
jgi:hypothetical protein